MRSTSLLAVLVGASSSDAFSGSLGRHPQPTVRPSTASGTALFGAKRRGRLTNNVSLDEDGQVKIISNKQKQKLGSSARRTKKGGRGSGGGDATISPLLAEWAKEEDGDGGATVATTTTSAKIAATPSASDVFASFDDDDEELGMGVKKGKRNKKSKQRSDRAKLSAAQSAQVDELLEKIAETLGTNNCDVASLVSDIRSLADLNASFSNDRTLLPSLKSVLSARPPPAKEGEKSTRPAYRLAWVGSDDAVCHVGTGLHKVPLARLQEMYLLLGYDKWELLEVIRVLGPFPNVRNTIKGEVKAKKLPSSEREGVRMAVRYDSMIDGTGKEILAGKDDNVKNVDLDVWFASERAIVCTVPDEEGGDALKGDGSKFLLFVREENLDDELERLRAA